MKHSLRLFSLLLLLVMAGAASNAFAQSTRFAFVNKERDMIYVYEGDQKDTLFKPIPSQKFRGDRLAVLGSSSDGKSLFVGGKIMYAALGSGVQDSIMGFFRVPIPPHGQPLDMTKMLTEGRVLRRVYEETTKILPLGVITPDDQHWFAIWMSAAPNNPDFKIYHGNFNENATPNNTNVDTVSITGAAAFDGGYHMSNVTCTEDGNMAMFAVIDKLQSGGLERAQLIRWIPGQPVSLTDFTGKINSVGPGPSADKAMAFAVRGIGTSAAPKLQMAVVTQANDDEIKIYEIQNPSNPAFNANFIKGTINRSALPTNYDFFTGYTQNTGDVYSEAPQQGNGGDMMFNRDGSKVIFITRSLVEDLNTRPEYSAIYEYGLTSGQINLLYNDVAQEERQPIFVDGTGIVPVAEQKLSFAPSTLSFGTVTIGSSGTKRLTITNVGTVPAMISGLNLGPINEYTVTANSLGISAPYAFTLAENASAWFDITFTPTIAGSPTSTITVNWSADSSRTITLTGTGQSQGSVARHYEEVFNFGVAPNPVQGATTITLKGVETSFATLELVDATGRTVWTASGKLTAGGTSTFEMNAQDLAAGSYFLVVRAADVQAVGQVVITK